MDAVILRKEQKLSGNCGLGFCEEIGGGPELRITTKITATVDHSSGGSFENQDVLCSLWGTSILFET